MSFNPKKAYDKDNSSWVPVTPHYYDSNDSSFKEALTHIYDENNQVWECRDGISSITISGDTGPTAGGSQEYTVDITYEDGSTSTDCTKLNWSIIQYGSDNTASIENVDPSSVTVYVGDDTDSPDFALRAESDCGIFDELDIDVVCLSVNTKILMSDGSQRKLGDIEKGDVVRAYNPETGEIADKEVAFVLEKHKRESMIKIEIEDKEPLEITPEHEVYVQRNNDEMWTEARNIEEGDMFMSEEMEWKSVKDICKIGGGKVSNIEVADLHVYFANDLLVHNQISAM